MILRNAKKTLYLKSLASKELSFASFLQKIIPSMHLSRLPVTFRLLGSGLAIGMILLFSLPVYAGAPLDGVRTNVNKVLDVLRDPKLKIPSAKEIKKRQLENLYGQMFNEVELARRTLAQHWNDLNGEQRREFVTLFRQILEKTYADRIMSYNNENIAFDGEVMQSDNKAEVQTRIITASKEISFCYRVIKTGSQWKVYDVVVENVSLVLNYRNQFNEILIKNTPEQLLDILRKKVKNN